MAKGNFRYSYIGLSVFNLFIVALLGVLMRYKIGFEFPYLDQKNLQHAHSHFAFYGWITHSLMTLIMFFLERKGIARQGNMYKYLLFGNMLCAYGMLFSFVIGGYNAVSIAFSTMALLISYGYTYQLVSDMKHAKVELNTTRWFLAAFIFNCLASLGTYMLAYMMATKHITQHIYLGSVYFFLHFQYNGWFFFAGMGLLNWFLETRIPQYKQNSTAFWMFALSCVPAYFLSALWMDLPSWLYWLVVAAAFVQFAAWLLWLQTLRPYLNSLKKNSSVCIYYLMILLALALSVKFLLQLGSVIPFVSTLAFGFRPIVIAYLHLVLLAIISVFLLGFLIAEKYIANNRISYTGFSIFVIGIYLTEFTLMVQGIASFSYTLLPFSNEILFGLSVIMLSGIGILLLGNRRR